MRQSDGTGRYVARKVGDIHVVYREEQEDEDIGEEITRRKKTRRTKWNGSLQE